MPRATENRIARRKTRPPNFHAQKAQKKDRGMRSFFLRGRAAAEPQNPPCGQDAPNA